jgi:glycosyltransferase involved in cell wall biosynthesis
VTSFIEKLPFKKTKYRNYLPLFPTAIEQFNLKAFDLIISTSHCVAKGVIVPPEALHISYVHTPMRYVWDMYHEYFRSDKLNWFNRIFLPYFANYLRQWDATSSHRVDWFIANSQHVANRIRKYYRRESEVINPPVDTDFFSVSHASEAFYLVVSALVPYKRIDLAIEAFNRLNSSLVVVGNGPEKRNLQKLAKSNISFVDWQTAERIKAYYEKCQAVIFPGEEDFGIVPVEAMACGKPVIAYGKGGVLETVRGYNGQENKNATGVFFSLQEVDSLIAAVKQSQKIDWHPDSISAYARRFGKEKFRSKILTFIESKMDQHLKFSA